ncbi:oligosaccharide flippase family protein [Morganella morganii subsp. morganii]|uniref:oligosaccharide flippase family protein n=1 Tax=Morganella morganii TaxID=582 RepID=UPI001BD915FF|nr:oligosaccharide flippase family protein [Morganella morganii]MBT0395907.1 oligosaccharide flippase family protein [Morganella morganii subsp. morganii]
MKKNIFFAILSTGTNYILPLVIIPFIIHKYGIIEYGKLSIVLSLCGILNLITNLNLDNTFASLKINTSKNTLQKIITLKLFMYVISLMIISLFVIFFIKEQIFLFILSAIPIIGISINANFILVKNENFKDIFKYNILSKLFFSSLTIIALSTNASLYTIGFLTNGWILSSSILSFINVSKNIEKNSDTKENSKNHIEILKKIIPGFTSSIASLALTMLVQPIIAIITNNNFTTIGLYSVAEKVIRAATGFFDAINNVLYSKLSTLKNKHEKNKIIKKTFIYYIFLCSVGIWILYYLTTHSHYLPKELIQIQKIEPYLLICGLLILIITIGNVISSMILFENRIFKEVTYIITISSIIFIALTFIPIKHKDTTFFLTCLLISEFISMILKGALAWKKLKFCK